MALTPTPTDSSKLFPGIARISLSPEADMQRIIDIARSSTPGASTADPPVYSEGRLYVPGVSQDALTRAAGQVFAVPHSGNQRRVASVRPVAFRTTLASMPPPDGAAAEIVDLEDAVSAAVAVMAKPFRIAWEYADRIHRSDLMKMGPELHWDEDIINAVLTAAAAQPGSEAIWEELRPDGTRVLLPMET